MRLETGALLLLSAWDVIFFKVLSPCLGSNSASIRLKHRLKAAISLAENLPCLHVVLASRNIRKDRVNATLNRFDGLSVPKHMVLLGHNISQHNSFHYKTLLQFGRENNITCIILCTSRRIFCIGCFSVIEYHKNPLKYERMSIS